MIIIINGSLGVGKSSVSEELYTRFEKSVYLDGDAMGSVHPFEIYDQARVAHLYETLVLLVEFHQQHGYGNFVINYVFESAAALQALLERLRPLDAAIHTYWLTCEPQEQARRIRRRGRSDIEWELNRYVELRAIQAQAALEGFIGKELDTTGQSATQMAGEIWKDIFVKPVP